MTIVMLVVDGLHELLILRSAHKTRPRRKLVKSTRRVVQHSGNSRRFLQARIVIERAEQLSELPIAIIGASVCHVNL
jgi:hypothetical protein